MSLFPRSYFGPEASFTPLFRLLDDFDNYSREVSSQNGGGNNKAGRRQALPTFSPRFDVKETEAAYELHGELPGIEKDNVHIEFTEPQTVVISGRTERHYTSGTPPAGLVEGGQQQQSITEGGENNNSHKASVADEEAEKAKEQGSQVATTNKNNKQPEKKQPAEKFWVSERSVGEFSRTFSFPTPVDQEGVVANLNNGVLSVTVPKAKKRESKRIAIN